MSNKIFNFAVISCLLNISSILCSVKFNDFLFLRCAFWLTCVMVVVFGILAIAFKIREYVKGEKRALPLKFVSGMLAMLGVAVLYVCAAVNLYGFLTWGDNLVPDAVWIVGAISIAVSAVLWLISLVGKKRSAEEKNSLMTYSKCLTFGAGLFVACFECFIVCIFTPTNNELIKVFKLGLCGISALLAVFFTLVATVIALKKKGVSSKVYAFSKALTAVAVLTVEFNLLLFAIELVRAYFSISSAVLGAISLLLFVVAAEFKVIHILKSKNSIQE